jgi:hypothetical protein
VSQDIIQPEPNLEQLQKQLTEQTQLVQQLQHRLTQGEAENRHLQHDLQQQRVLATLKGPKPPETNGKTPTPEHFCEAFEVYMAQKQLDPDTPAACGFAALFLRDAADAAMDWYAQHQRDVAAGLSAPFSSFGSTGGNSGYRGGFSGSRQFGGSSGHSGGPAPMDLGSMQQQQRSTPGGSKPYCSWHKCPGHWTRDCRARARKLGAQHAAGAAGKQ